MALSSSRQGHLAMLSFSALVSLSFSFGHIVAKEITPTALNTVRFALAALVLFGLARVLRISVRPVFTGFWRFGLMGGLMAVYFITMFEALRVTTAVSTAAVFTLTPLMAAGCGLLIAGQRSGRWTLIALTIGAVGAVWVIFRADIGALMRFELGRGEALFSVGALAHALVPALARKLASDVKPLQTSLGTVLGALIVTGLYGFGDLVHTDFSALRPAVWMVIAYLAVVTTAGTFFLVQYAAQRLPAGKVMAYTYLVPSWVVLWDFLFYGTTPPALLLAGVAATLLALAMLLRGEAP
ncbi:DMT family transporter [Aliiroseovarius sp. F47248L]|uniref:DMT family transporter n=1 Tax=Aliiroseovarius sp. F47248L TaxID=2926420 RepID=UPI001FF27520|nr:DMT family transporter [Aliiroseovarius sp. F47248L]MCK0137898.1 DMT family transporter [Aliiroseovarius sp. F47248L]